MAPVPEYGAAGTSPRALLSTAAWAALGSAAILLAAPPALAALGPLALAPAVLGLAVTAARAARGVGGTVRTFQALAAVTAAGVLGVSVLAPELLPGPAQQTFGAFPGATLALGAGAALGLAWHALRERRYVAGGVGASAHGLALVVGAASVLLTVSTSVQAVQGAAMGIAGSLVPVWALGSALVVGSRTVRRRPTRSGRVVDGLALDTVVAVAFAGVPWGLWTVVPLALAVGAVRSLASEPPPVGEAAEQHRPAAHAAGLALALALALAVAASMPSKPLFLVWASDLGWTVSAALAGAAIGQPVRVTAAAWLPLVAGGLPAGAAVAGALAGGLRAHGVRGRWLGVAIPGAVAVGTLADRLDVAAALPPVDPLGIGPLALALVGLGVVGAASFLGPGGLLATWAPGGPRSDESHAAAARAAFD